MPESSYEHYEICVVINVKLALISYNLTVSINIFP